MRKLKNRLIIILIIMVFLCACNIVFPLIFKDAEETALLVTIISGWVSGVATLIVGLITYLQAKHYNDENTKFIEKQFEVEQGKSIIQSRILFVNDFKKLWNKFVDECNPVKMSDDLLVLVNDSYGIPAYEQTARILVKSAMETTTLCNSIQNHIILDYLDDDKKNELRELIDNYNKEYNDYITKFAEPKNLSTLNVKEVFDVVVNDFGKKFLKIIQTGNEYLTKIDMDINFSINYKIDNIEYLKEHYSAVKKDDLKHY